MVEKHAPVVDELAGNVRGAANAIIAALMTRLGAESIAFSESEIDSAERFTVSVSMRSDESALVLTLGERG